MARGRQFLCTECGECCRQPGVVFMGLGELRALARYLELSVAELKRRYPIQWDPDQRCYELVAGEDGCVFLEGDRCGVHPAKPVQCQVFPFWPELVEDAGAWREAKSVCEGLDHAEGPLFSFDDMRARARQYRYG